MIDKIPCWECDSGYYEVHFIDYERHLGPSKTIIIPNTKILICNKCKDEIFDHEGMEHIDKYIEQYKLEN